MDPDSLFFTISVHFILRRGLSRSASGGEVSRRYFRRFVQSIRLLHPFVVVVIHEAVIIADVRRCTAARAFLYLAPCTELLQRRHMWIDSHARKAFVVWPAHARRKTKITCIFAPQIEFLPHLFKLHPPISVVLLRVARATDVRHAIPGSMVPSVLLMCRRVDS